MSYEHRSATLKLLARAEVHVTILAAGVVAKIETCPHPRCGAATIVVRGPGHHDDSFICDACGTVIEAT